MQRHVHNLYQLRLQPSGYFFRGPIRRPFRKSNYQGANIGNIRPVWANSARKCWPLESIESIISGDCFDNEIQNSSLRRRGWILALDPKVLHFGENQPYWDAAVPRNARHFLVKLSFSGSRL